MADGLRSRNDENEVDRYRKLKFEDELVINHVKKVFLVVIAVT